MSFSVLYLMLHFKHMLILPNHGTIYSLINFIQVQLNFTINALIYNTSKAYYRCSLGSGLCSLSLDPLGTTSAVLTSPGPIEVID